MSETENQYPKQDPARVLPVGESRAATPAEVPVVLVLAPVNDTQQVAEEVVTGSEDTTLLFSSSAVSEDHKSCKTARRSLSRLTGRIGFFAFTYGYFSGSWVMQKRVRNARLYRIFQLDSLLDC